MKYIFYYYYFDYYYPTLADQKHTSKFDHFIQQHYEDELNAVFTKKIFLICFRYKLQTPKHGIGRKYLRVLFAKRINYMLYVWIQLTANRFALRWLCLKNIRIENSGATTESESLLRTKAIVVRIFLKTIFHLFSILIFLRHRNLRAKRILPPSKLSSYLKRLFFFGELYLLILSFNPMFWCFSRHLSCNVHTYLGSGPKFKWTINETTFFSTLIFFRHRFLRTTRFSPSSKLSSYNLHITFFAEHFLFVLTSDPMVCFSPVIYSLMFRLALIPNPIDHLQIIKRTKLYFLKNKIFQK